MKCFYHDDADGKCAGFWVYLNVGIKIDSKTGEPQESECIAINYNDKFPLDKIKENEQIWIVDFSIPVEDMEKLLQITKDVTWIDHHISSISKYKDFKEKINGVRYDGISGCELTYAYIHKMTLDRGNSGIIEHDFNEEMLKDCPLMTRYVGDRDVWKFKFGDNSRYFYEAFLMAGQPNPDSEWWFNVMDTLKLEQQISIGDICREHSKNLSQSTLKSWGYEAKFKEHIILVCNSTNRSSDLFGDKINDYPFVCAYTHDGNKFFVSFYSVNMDVNHYAEEFGGGGHKRACGFVCDELPFKRIYK